MREREADYTFEVGHRLHAGFFIPAAQLYPRPEAARPYLRRLRQGGFRGRSTCSSRRCWRSRCRPSPRPPASTGKAYLDMVVALTRNTKVINYLGLPAISVPCGFTSNGLPTSFQLIGRPLQEAALLRAADRYQHVTDWHLREPPDLTFLGNRTAGPGVKQAPGHFSFAGSPEIYRQPATPPAGCCVSGRQRRLPDGRRDRLGRLGASDRSQTAPEPAPHAIPQGRSSGPSCHGADGLARRRHRTRPQSHRPRRACRHTIDGLFLGDEHDAEMVAIIRTACVWSEPCCCSAARRSFPRGYLAFAQRFGGRPDMHSLRHYCLPDHHEIFVVGNVHEPEVSTGPAKRRLAEGRAQLAHRPLSSARARPVHLPARHPGAAGPGRHTLCQRHCRLRGPARRGAPRSTG